MTWISPARFAWQRAVLVAVFVGGGVFALVAFVKAEPRWALAFLAFSPLPVALLAVLMRCRGCGRSATWWGARHVRKADFLGAIRSMEACPYCGHSEER